MTWYLYLITFKLLTPLHIGFHKVMHLFRTRLYVPAKPFWGALTAKMTRYFKSNNYCDIGNALKEVMRFGYFYLSDGKEIFIPKYEEKGIKYGKLSRIEFEKKFLYSLTSTAIDPYSSTAEEQMLHEVEYINPYIIENNEEMPKPVYIKGIIWVSEYSGSLSIKEFQDNDFLIEYKNILVVGIPVKLSAISIFS